MPGELVRVPDVPPQDPGALTYEPYFGLREKCFSLSPDPRFFFRNSTHGPAFGTVLGGIRRREGILALTGEVGTGKTTLCQAVLEALDRKTFAAFIPDPILSREDLLKTLLVDFGVVSVEEILGGRLRGASRTELSYPLYEFLTSLQPLHAFAVVMIDEAQNLPTSLLEEIRILADMEKRQKLLQLVLIGQPELQSRLGTPEMRQLTQRLSVRCELHPLPRSEVGLYVSHRLAIAGNRTPIFSETAISLVYAASRGIPRVINLLCDGALARAASAGVMTVNAEHIMGSAEDLRLPQTRFGAVLWERQKAAQSDAHGEGSSSAAEVSAANRNDALPRIKTLPAAMTPLSGALVKTPAIEPREPISADVLEDVPQRRWPRFAAVAIALLALTATVLWNFRSTPTASVPETSTPRFDSRAATPVAPTGSPSVLFPAMDSRPAEPSTPAMLTPAPPTLAAGAEPARFVIQMATFQTALRAAQSVEEFHNAGFPSYSLEVVLRDGRPAFAVFLGPYPELAHAEQELERANQIPGYGTGRIVQSRPSSQLKTQS